MKLIIKTYLLLLFLTANSLASDDYQNFELSKNYSKEIVENFISPKTMGYYKLKILGFNIYDIKLITERNSDQKSYKKKFAINILYKRNFTKKELVEASIEEIKRINLIDSKKEKLYTNYLEKIFVDVGRGDIKTAFVDDSGLKLYYNSELISNISDYEFAIYFADIWLSEKAKYKTMQRKLLGYE